jgi:hypothetical protein
LRRTVNLGASYPNEAAKLTLIRARIEAFRAKMLPGRSYWGLRQASEPLTTRDIALQLLVERALDKSDQRLLRLMTKRVGVALRGQRENVATVRTLNAADRKLVTEGLNTIVANLTAASNRSIDETPGE